MAKLETAGVYLVSRAENQDFQDRGEFIFFFIIIELFIILDTTPKPITLKNSETQTLPRIGEFLRYDDKTFIVSRITHYIENGAICLIAVPYEDELQSPDRNLKIIK